MKFTDHAVDLSAVTVVLQIGETHRPIVDTHGSRKRIICFIGNKAEDLAFEHVDGVNQGECYVMDCKKFAKQHVCEAPSDV